MQISIFTQIILSLVSIVMLAVSIYFLSIYKRLFSGIRNVWLRRNLAVLLVAICFMCSLMTFSSEILAEAAKKGWVKAVATQLGQSAIISLFVFNTVWLISRIPWVRKLSFIKQHAIVIFSIVLSTLIIYAALNYITNYGNFNRLHATLMFGFYNSFAAGLIYTAVNYVELDRKRKLNEKELEVTRLSELKTKAELDALHSKVNPHFLYNALNSIADLSITDGRKARRMTIALADLFRYSINYSHNNFSTVNEIEKIRFEDQLTYTVDVDEDLGHYLVPRFVLQPLVENAVKHGLKITGAMTEIKLAVKKQESGFIITIADNGPAFPDELVPGYGVKSVYDKLDLLFPGQYEIHFSNQPVKQLAIYMHKLMKNEPAV
jgi:two-component system LytT family sensor kinase